MEEGFVVQCGNGVRSHPDVVEASSMGIPAR